MLWRLTVRPNEAGGREEGQQDEQAPEAELDHPATVVPSVALVTLVLHANEHQGKQGEERLQPGGRTGGSGHWQHQASAAPCTLRPMCTSS